MSDERPIKDSNTVRIIQETELKRKSPQTQEDLDWRPEYMQSAEERGVKWQDPEVYSVAKQIDPEQKISYPTPTAARIFGALVPEWQQQFLEKNEAYGEDPAPLGPIAEFVEIWRKAKKLRRRLWEAEDIGNEDVREVTLDMIGHCFLLLDLLDGAGNVELRLDIEEQRDRDGE